MIKQTRELFADRILDLRVDFAGDLNAEREELLYVIEDLIVATVEGHIEPNRPAVAWHWTAVDGIRAELVGPPIRASRMLPAPIVGRVERDDADA